MGSYTMHKLFMDIMCEVWVYHFSKGCFLIVSSKRALYFIEEVNNFSILQFKWNCTISIIFKF